MVNYIIAGNPDCPQYVHAVHVAKYLENRLPNFKLKTIEYFGEDWLEYLMKKRMLYNWYHSESPLIYKELLYHGGVPHYIGGLSEFWEYCFDYYGLESLLSPEDLENLIRENMEYHASHPKHKKRPTFYMRKSEATPYFQQFCRFVYSQKLDLDTDTSVVVLIYGPEELMTEMLISQLFELDELLSGKTLCVLLYKDLLSDEQSEEFNHLVVELENSYNCQTRCVTELEGAIEISDLILFLENTSPLEDFDNDVNSLKVKLRVLCQALDVSAKPTLRLVFCNNGSSCFTATYIIRHSSISPYNIVIITSDVGLGYVNEISKQARVKLDQLGGPPVWGFIGVNEFVDVEHIVKKCRVYKPYKRAITSKDNSTLIHGTISTELRFINYLVNNEINLKAIVEENRNLIVEKLNRTAIYSKVRATISLLKLWYAKVPSTQIISLGIYSNGSFGITDGIYFSQPAVLEKGVWVPCIKFPVSDECLEKIGNLVTDTITCIDDRFLKMIHNAN